MRPCASKGCMLATTTTATRANNIIPALLQQPGTFTFHGEVTGAPPELFSCCPTRNIISTVLSGVALLLRRVDKIVLPYSCTRRTVQNSALALHCTKNNRRYFYLDVVFYNSNAPLFTRGVRWAVKTAQQRAQSTSFVQGFLRSLSFEKMTGCLID